MLPGSESQGIRTAAFSGGLVSGEHFMVDTR